MEKAVRGKRGVIEHILAALLAEGHILLDDMPGVGKTTLALAFARALGEYGATSMIAGYTPGKTATIAASAAWALALSAFLQATGRVPLAWWIPCMAMAILSMLLFLWVTRSITLLEAGYVCARAFILAELAASVEWQLHCVLWPQRGGAEPLSLLLLAVVYGGIFAAMLFVENRRPGPAGKLKITPAGTFVAVVMALTAFAVSNLSFANGSEANMNMFYIRTLVDLAGVLILTVQHEQLREAALHSELAELDGVLHRQYEQYKQSKENIRLINRRYHELKMQIAAIRAERDQAKQDVALAAMESGIRQYEAENKTGNPVLDTLLTAKSLYCQQHDITMTCVADGHLLDFLETGEICTIVGTALDNATESVEAEPDHEKRLIRVAVYAQNGFVMLRFENYCASPVELAADGLPKRSAHGGYDLKSVRAAAENQLSRALFNLQATAEAYPQLQANQNFMDLQNQLKELENKIAYARQFYNDVVLKLNTAIETVPTNIIAGLFHFEQAQYFEADDASRQVPQVQF